MTTKIGIVNARLFGQQKIHGEMFFVALVVQTSFFPSPPVRTLLAVSGFYLPVGYKSPEFSILANPSVPRVRYRRKGFPSPDWTALSFHFLLWISGLGIFLFSPFPRVYTLKLAINFSDRIRTVIMLICLPCSPAMPKHRSICYLTIGIFE